MRVSAVNTAGEGAYNQADIWLGVPPSPPLNPRMTSVTPLDQLVLEWDRPTSDGCLPILSYTLSKNGVDHVTDINPTSTAVIDDISVGGTIGALI